MLRCRKQEKSFLYNFEYGGIDKGGPRVVTRRGDAAIQAIIVMQNHSLNKHTHKIPV